MLAGAHLSKLCRTNKWTHNLIIIVFCTLNSSRPFCRCSTPLEFNGYSPVISYKFRKPILFIYYMAKWDNHPRAERCSGSGSQEVNSGIILRQFEALQGPLLSRFEITSSAWNILDVKTHLPPRLLPFFTCPVSLSLSL